MTTNMDFGQALALLKAGRCVARRGWNGKGMFLLLIPGSTFAVAPDRPMARHFPVGSTVRYHAHIDMKTAQGDVVPWLASQTDVLAEDWEEYLGRVELKVDDAKVIVTRAA